jgi:ABC-type multidrug transport system ATPase subunit
VSEIDDRAAAISTSELSKAYGEVPALWPIDLEVPAGQRLSLIGHNGSGKTTLIRMLAGVLEPTGGTATIAGHPIGSPDARAAMSYLSDQPVFYDDLSVWQHLEYIARLHRTDDWEDHASSLLDSLGIAHRADDLPITFSRGLKQKASIAIAFVRPFDVMLIDEPFVGLDSAGRSALLDLIDWAHRDGASMVVATHELTSVSASDRLIALSDGQVVYDGAPVGADLDLLVTAAPPDEVGDSIDPHAETDTAPNTAPDGEVDDSDAE